MLHYWNDSILIYNSQQLIVGRVNRLQGRHIQNKFHDRIHHYVHSLKIHCQLLRIQGPRQELLDEYSVHFEFKEKANIEHQTICDGVNRLLELAAKEQGKEPAFHCRYDASGIEAIVFSLADSKEFRPGELAAELKTARAYQKRRVDTVRKALIERSPVFYDKNFEMWRLPGERKGEGRYELEISDTFSRSRSHTDRYVPKVLTKRNSINLHMFHLLQIHHRLYSL